MPARLGPALLPSSGDKRVAGDAGAEHLRTGIAGIGRQRIVGAPTTTAPIGSPLIASQRRMVRSAPPVNNVRLSGKNATDHTGRPGPTSVRSSLRVLRSITATEPRMPAAATSLPSGEIATAMIGVGEACRSPRNLALRRQEIDFAVGAGGDDLAVGRDRHGIERRRQVVHASLPSPASGQMRNVAS